jgi:hypothetical protein
VSFAPFVSARTPSPPIAPLKPALGSLLELAVNHLLAYVLGCQPELYRRETVGGGGLRITEPGNLNGSGWPLALCDLALWLRLNPDYSIETILRRTALTAALTATDVGLDLGIELPLLRPRALAAQPAYSWAELTPYFQSSKY